MSHGVQVTQIVLQKRCIYIRWFTSTEFEFDVWHRWKPDPCSLTRVIDSIQNTNKYTVEQESARKSLPKTRMCNLHVQVEPSSMGSCMPEKGFLSRRQENQRISTLIHDIWLKKHPNSKTCSFCVGINVELLDYKRMSLWWNAHVIWQGNPSYCKSVYGD